MNETSTERKNRFVNGLITADEIREHWDNNRGPLFEYSINRGNKTQHETKPFRVRALTPDLAEPLFRALAKSWAWQNDAESLKSTVNAFHVQRTVLHRVTLNPEYYAATDISDRPFAMTGLYTRDLEGQGFALVERLDPERHYLNVGLGWFAVAPEKQRSGAGGFLLEWTVRMAAARGAKRMIVETDDSEGETVAVALYEKRGYRRGFDIRNYYGPGRDKRTYYAFFPSKTKPPFFTQRITHKNVSSVRTLAQRVYSPDRLEEFYACVDLLLEQIDCDPVMESPISIVHTGKDDTTTAFAVLAPSLYSNAVIIYWYASQPGNSIAYRALMKSIEQYAASIDRETVIVHREGEDTLLEASGYHSTEDGIPFVYAKGDTTHFLLYSKDL